MSGPCVADTNTVTLSVPDGATLQGDVNISPVYDNGVQGEVDGLWVPGRQVVVAMPTGSAYDGQVVFRQIDSGVMSQFRFNEGSANPDKWECISGASVMVEDSTEFDLTVTASPSGNWVDGGSQKLQIATPLTGVWDIEHEALVSGPGGSGNQAIGVGLGGADPNTLTIGFNNANGGGVTIHVYHRVRISQGALVKQMFQNTVPSTTLALSRRKLSIRPVRVS